MLLKRILFSKNSEQNADVVPAPQAQTSSSSPSSTPGDATASSSPQSPQDNIHLPPPPLPGHPAGAYHTVKRKGTAGSEELEGNLATLGGRPRSVEGFPAELRGARRRRSGDEVLEDEDSVSCSTFLLVVYIYLHIINQSLRLVLFFMLVV